ncbi:disease resistance protein RPV1-like [Telopea speciosissima]|uniref:disease resistance protein RPV1-like n=1 Tax=Telopea speciosissima TaxID=54955 RepID=UPI001CC7D636|nr:disease resistance protein RPV1-like [Telopea speciosissima]
MVEGILLDWKFESAAKDDLSYENFVKMHNSRFLHFDFSDVNVNGDFPRLPSKIRWFHWNSCPLTVLPANFYHEELVLLELSESDIKLDWNDKPQNKNKRFQKLKVLIMYECRNLFDSPDFFAWFPCLQRLDLSWCISLLELPDSICQIVSLKSLILDDCKSFNELPTSIGDLKHLVELSVSGTKIKELPDGVGQLEKLEKLNVSWCLKLGRLPTSMGRMRSLLRFELGGTIIVNLPDDFSKLSGLEVLKMGIHTDCEELGCNKLTKLPDLSSLKRLRVLDINHCVNLEEIHGLEKFESLEELEARCCYKLTDTTKQTHGQGMFLHNFDGQEGGGGGGSGGQGNNLIDEIHHYGSGRAVRVNIVFEIEASIRWRSGKEKSCICSIRIEDIKITPRDVIYIHHFNVNGFPFQSKAAIEKFTIQSLERYEQSGQYPSVSVKVKFWKVLFENKESEQQMPNQQSSAMLVADFFRWSSDAAAAAAADDDDDEVEESQDEEEEE